MTLDWHSSWEDALFEGNSVLRDYAHARALEHEIISMQEVDGRIQAHIKVPQGAAVQVQVSLPRRSLQDWEEHLTQLRHSSPEICRSLSGRPDLVLHSFLSLLGWPLLPLGMQEVQVQVSPSSRKKPCPFSLGVLVESGWMIESDPWILLSMRGLSLENARYMLRNLENGASQFSPIGRPAKLEISGQNSVGSAVSKKFLSDLETPSESFWGNARAIRAFQPQLFLGSSSTPPKFTLGAPPLEDAQEMQLLANMLSFLFNPRS